MSELEIAEHKKAYWEATLCYYEAERAQTETYALRQKSLNAGKKEILPSDPAIDHAIAAAHLWQKAALSYKQGYESADFRFQEVWKAELPLITQKANQWYDAVRWCAEQGGRSSDAAVVAVVKKIPSPPVKLPSPLDRLSDQEKKDYRGVKLLAYKEFTDLDPVANPKGYKVHIRILKRKKKIDPYMRVEEWIDGTGALIERSEMAADHLLVRLKEGMSEENLLEELEKRGCSGSSLRRVTNAVPLYELSLVPREAEKWEEVWEQAVDAVKEMELKWEPDFFYYDDVASGMSYRGSRPPQDWHLNSTWGINFPEEIAGAPNIKIGICDTGIDHTHPELEKNINNGHRLNIQRALETPNQVTEKECVLEENNTTEEVTPESSSPTREARDIGSEDEKRESEAL